MSEQILNRTSPLEGTLPVIIVDVKVTTSGIADFGLVYSTLRIG